MRALSLSLFHPLSKIMPLPGNLFRRLGLGTSSEDMHKDLEIKSQDLDPETKSEDLLVMAKTARGKNCSQNNYILYIAGSHAKRKDVSKQVFTLCSNSQSTSSYTRRS